MADGRALAAAAASSGLVGLSIVLTKAVEAFVDPVTLALVRYAIGAVFLLPFVLGGNGKSLRVRSLIPAAVLGLVQFAALTVLLNLALQYASAGSVALLFSLFPCLTLVLGFELGRDSLTRWKVLGVTLCFGAAGLGVISSIGPSGGGGERWIGDLLALGSALCGAICAVLYRPFLEASSILPFGGFAMLSAVAALAPVSLALHPWSDLRLLSAQIWFALLALGSFSAVGYGLWLWAFRHSSPTRVTVFVGLSPIIAALAGAFFLNEPFTWVEFAAVIVLIAGLWVTQWNALPGRKLI